MVRPKSMLEGSVDSCQQLPGKWNLRIDPDFKDRKYDVSQASSNGQDHATARYKLFAVAPMMDGAVNVKKTTG